MIHSFQDIDLNILSQLKIEQALSMKNALECTNISLFEDWLEHHINSSP